MPSIADAAQWAENICNAPNYGYSQAHRNQELIDGIFYYDCSSFIWYALKNGGGFDVVAANNGSTWPFTTATMPNVLPALGFTAYNACNVIWQRGDIVLSDSHTEMVYQNATTAGRGQTMGAHASVDGNGNPIPLADQISINGVNTCSYFPRLYRFGGGGGGIVPPIIPRPRRKSGLKVWQMLKRHY